MTASKDVTVLQDVLRRESRSFLQYLADTKPWTSDVDPSTLQVIQEVISSERAVLAELAQSMQQHHVTLPYPSSYSTSFTSLNFISLKPLIKRMAAAEVELLEQLRESGKGLSDGELCDLVRELIELKAKNLEKLQALQAPAMSSLP